MLAWETVSNLKLINVPFAFRLTVNSSSVAALSIALEQNPYELMGLFAIFFVHAVHTTAGTGKFCQVM